MGLISVQPKELLNVGHIHKRNTFLNVVTLEFKKKKNTVPYCDKENSYLSSDF